MHLTHEQQHIACQMGQGAISVFILAPTPINLSTPYSKLLVEPESFGVIDWQGIPLRFIPGNLLLELINLSAGSCLSAIKTASIEEKWSSDLLALFVDGCGSQ